MPVPTEMVKDTLNQSMNHIGNPDNQPISPEDLASIQERMAQQLEESSSTGQNAMPVQHQGYFTQHRLFFAAIAFAGVFIVLIAIWLRRSMPRLEG
jgi:hypothetical protein